MPRAERPLEITDVCTRAEVMLLLSAAARKGNVPAMHRLLEELPADDGTNAVQTPSVFDELDLKRKKAAGIG